MSVISDTESELDAMLDDGVSVRITADEAGGHTVRVLVEEHACADCLVPDATLSSIAADSLRRRGAVVTSVVVEHEQVSSSTGGGR
jgi:hypothetical protein